MIYMLGFALGLVAFFFAFPKLESFYMSSSKGRVLCLTPSTSRPGSSCSAWW
ncbi:MAG: hypothetical protein U0263_17460 [Polyangiaceae bacterium]